jgi:hypothetical protein
MEWHRQEEATAKRMASAGADNSSVFKANISPAPKESPPPTLSIIDFIS